MLNFNLFWYIINIYKFLGGLLCLHPANFKADDANADGVNVLEKNVYVQLSF